MINEETRRKLKELNISELAVALEQQQKDPLTAKLSFDERFQRLVDYLYQEKYNCKIQRLIKTAKFRFPQADRHLSVHSFQSYHCPSRLYWFRKDLSGMCTW